jgi:hypothetical protein
VKLSLEHAIVSMSDTYVDTPGREDGQWLEDARLRGELSAQWFGDIKLRQLFLQLVAQSQRIDGTFHPFPPSNYPIVSNPDWAAEWVGALYDDYLWTSETIRIRKYWPQVRAFWSHVLSSVNPDGLWIEDKVFADIRVGIHPGPGQSSGIVTAQLIDRLALSIEMAKASGFKEDARQWQVIHNDTLAAFTREHLVPAFAGTPLHVDDVADPRNHKTIRGFSQAAQVMAVGAGLLSGADARADLEFAFPGPDGSPPSGVDRWNNPTYLFRALDALSSVNLSDRASQHLLERFSPYLPGDPHNTTPGLLQGKYGGPLPEYWISRDDLRLAPGTKAPTQPIDASGSHGWNAVGLVWLHTRLLGVTLATPGGREVNIHPDAGGFNSIDGTTMTPRGPISIAWKPLLRRLSISLPLGVIANVQLPEPLSGLARIGKLTVPDSCVLQSTSFYRCRGRSIHFAAAPR